MRSSMFWTANVALIFLQLLYWAWTIPVPRASNETSLNDTNLTWAEPQLVTPPSNIAVVVPNSGAADTSLHHEANHNLAVEQQNHILHAGQQFSLGLTKTILRPFTMFNNGISAAASALPSIMAAQGAALGAVIAAPVQFGTMAANTVASGVTGTLVSIPVSLVAGGTAHLAGLAETGRQILNSDIPQRLLDQGQVIMKPVALVAGSNSILAGVGVGLLSSGVKNIGQGVERVGLHLTHHGNNVKNAGSRLTGWFYGRPLYLESNSTLDNSTMQTPLANDTLVIVPIEQEVIVETAPDGQSVNEKEMIVTEEPQVYQLITDQPFELITTEASIHHILTTEAPHMFVTDPAEVVQVEKVDRPVAEASLINSDAKAQGEDSESNNWEIVPVKALLVSETSESEAVTESISL